MCAVQPAPAAQPHGMPRLAGPLDGLIQIAQPGHRQQLLRHVVLNPRRRAQRRHRIAFQVALLHRLRVAHHVPPIAGQVVAMNNQHAHGSAPRRFLILVGPAPVVGERLALEKLLVVRGGSFTITSSNLALHVDIFSVRARVVVPVVLGRIDAVAHKHNRRIDVGASPARSGP